MLHQLTRDRSAKERAAEQINQSELTTTKG